MLHAGFSIQPVRLEDDAYEGFYAEAPPRIPGDIAFYESMARRADQFSRLPVATVRARSTAMNREVRLRAVFEKFVAEFGGG